ncbi:hypothetical protein GGC64_006215 [Mycobacterium sp. OAS707]|uniref:hypothetical protein n=1 Tax=Mycobacterium sp. OAS707 TaxID=2663822 RepID=UPI00178B3414|nr:hypothetical protein [Mycobacterium sp. OAS707]MBE1552128.1 hypothetical protein [Mycobacterium sp. OAS707]
MIEMNDADQEAWHPGGYLSVQSATLTGCADTVRQRLADMVDAGTTEIIIEPSGPDITREMSAFMTALGQTAPRASSHADTQPDSVHTRQPV